MLTPEQQELAQTMKALAAEAYGVSVEQLGSRTRRRPVMRARQSVAYALADRGWSSRCIQEALGVPQATVVYMIGAVEVFRDKEQAATIRLLRGA